MMEYYKLNFLRAGGRYELWRFDKKTHHHYYWNDYNKTWTSWGPTPRYIKEPDLMARQDITEAEAFVEFL